MAFRRERGCLGLDTLKMINLKIGDKAPDFELNDAKGNKTKLADFRGKKIILYFYPRDDTSGCTKEACNFRDNFKGLRKFNIEIIGISNDNEQSHKKFTEKYSLPFKLLCDVDKEVSKKYGVYELKNFMGRSYYGITRSTFIIDEKGKITDIFYKVNPEKHVYEVKEKIKQNFINY